MSIRSGPYLNSPIRTDRDLPRYRGCYGPKGRQYYKSFNRDDDDGVLLSGLGVLIFRLLNLPVPVSKLKPIRTNKNG